LARNAIRVAPAGTDALGNLISFCLMPGQAQDLRETAELIEGV
jgi:hypothetical protein